MKKHSLWYACYCGKESVKGQDIDDPMLRLRILRASVPLFENILDDKVELK